MINEALNEPTFDTVRRNVFFEESFSFFRTNKKTITHLCDDQSKSNGGCLFWLNFTKPTFLDQDDADNIELTLLEKDNSLYSPEYDYYIVNWVNGTTSKLNIGDASAIKALQRKIVLKKLSDEDRKILGFV